MGLNYSPVLWNEQKKVYDRWILILLVGYLFVFAVLSIITHPEITPETLIIRAFGTLALFILHVILAIGPLCRINKKYLPFLYNRRHLGVIMFLAAAVHGIFSIIQFHTLANVNPIVSLFTSNMDYTSLVNFPFQVLGFIALIQLFLMAATSHDFWLVNLGAKTWKALHMMVYIAYALIILHVFLGAFQYETSPVLLFVLGLGLVFIIGLHVHTGLKEYYLDKQTEELKDNWQYVCKLDEIIEDRAKMKNCDGERIAVFKYEGKLSAVSNVCKHQNGPLGEGKIVDGCITCPWHGYQYLPHNGQSPPPFTEKVATFELKLEGDKVYVNPNAKSEGTEVEPLKFI